MIEKSNVKDLYPLSPMQEGMLFHALENPASPAYFEQVSYRVNGPLSLPLFARAWNHLFARHDILRTAFLHERTKRPLQVVLKERPMPIAEQDLRGLPEPGQQRLLNETRAADKARGFHLKDDPLLRATVLTLGENCHEIILSFHHILMDGWCMGMLNAEFLQVYDALRRGDTPQLPPPVPYQRYIQWLEHQDRAARLDFWKQRLDGLAGASLLPGRRRNATAAEYRLERRHTPFDAAPLRATAAAWGLTLNSLLQTAWALVLSRYTGLDDVVFGAIVSGRPAEIPDVDRILGLFINLIPVRARLTHATDARALATQLHSTFLDALQHSYSPISEAAAAAGRPHGLFDHILVFENYPDRSASAGPLEVACTDRFEQTSYDLVIVIAPGDTIDIAFHYNAHAFDAALIERLQAAYVHTLRQLAANPPLAALDILPPAEHETLALWSQGLNTPATPGTLIDRFEAQARRTPQAPAIHDTDGTTWSYAALNARADALAAWLIAQGIQPEERVAVAVPRSRWLPLALLGICKAGAVYLPIDPETPPDRIRFYQQDAGARLVLTVETLAALPTEAPPAARPIHPQQLAYAIYTSGSTGTPKAVAISHHAAGNLVDWHCRAFAPTASRATLFASPAFDASLWEILPYLLSGGCLYPVPDAARTQPGQLLDFYLHHGITHAFVPPAVCQELARLGGGRLSHLCLLAGGDVLPATTGLANLHNNYGPTESAVVATSIPITAGMEEPLPIGRPIDNTEILILDPQGCPTPIGVAGELYIASESLARGYLNRPALTAERFVPHPHTPGARLYRTGDLGYWHNGAIVFAGRNDHQVKLNGVRVELGEIEAALRSHPAITDAAAALRPNGSLAAWIVTANHTPPEDLRAHLAARLPAALLPARLASIDALPRTRNGKLDRAALLATESAPTTRRPPITDRQRDLAALWTEVLAVADIALDDDFFALGGHSLSVTRLVSRIRDKFQVDLPLRAVFEAPTLEALDHAIAALAATPSATPLSDPPLVARRREARKPVLEGKES